MTTTFKTKQNDFIEDVQQQKKKSTLHETTSKSFSRTPKGLIFTKDVKDVFSLMLISLDLKDKTKKKISNPFFNGNYGYFCFSLIDAINSMHDLNLNVETKSTTISISYSIKPEMAFNLITLFMNAKLLHTPADRTRTDPKEKILLQPTPKGVYVLQKYVKDTGIKKVPAIVYSALNSNQLFSFERSSVTDRIIYNEYFIKLFFVKMMGSAPNSWTPDNPNDKLPTLGQLLEYNDESFSFETLDFSNGITTALLNHNKTFQEQPEDSLIANIPENDLTNENRVSPLAHKFFTNPDSDSHVQYYTSNSGLRLFKNKQFGKKLPKTIEFTFTSKSIVQWIMDCTDIIYPKEAITIAALMYKHGLIVPVTGTPSETTPLKFSVGKLCYYTLTSTSCEILEWETETKNKFSRSMYGPTINDNSSVESSDNNNTNSCEEQFELTNISNSNKTKISKSITLAEILNDPGIRFLFRTHLERELCVENLDAYIEIKKVLKKLKILKTLVESRTRAKINTKTSKLHDSVVSKTKPSSFAIKSTISNALVKEADDCLSIVYNIYSMYITIGAPRQVNIDFNLREKISAIVLHPDSPITQSFNRQENIVGVSPQNHNKLEITVKTLTQEEESKYAQEKFQIPSTNKLKRLEKPKSLDFTNATQIMSPYNGGFDDNALSSYPELLTPTDEVISHAMKTLNLLCPLFEMVNEKLFIIMKSDSFTKFLDSGSL